MKAISVRQPWASFLAGGEKSVECRTWRCKYRGPRLICSSKGDYPINDGLIAPGGMGLGVIELVDVRPMTKADVPAAMLLDDDVKEARRHRAEAVGAHLAFLICHEPQRREDTHL